MAGKKPEEQVGKMTLEEKAGLCSGADVWHLKSCERLGIKGVMVSDGPHGLRTQRADGDNLGINGSIEAVCFPLPVPRRRPSTERSFTTSGKLWAKNVLRKACRFCWDRR